MAKQTIESGFPRSFDMFEEYRENYSRFTALTANVLSRAGRVDVLEETMFEVFGSPQLPDVLSDLITEWQATKPGRQFREGLFECELLLRHYEAPKDGREGQGWTEIEMVKAIQKSSLEEWERFAIPAPELEIEPVIPQELLDMNPQERKDFVDMFNKRKDPWKGPDYPKMNLSSISIGYEKGERCNRDGCLGFIEMIKEDPERSCTCFQGNPPCNVCMDKYLGCPVCDWDSREVEEALVEEKPEEGIWIIPTRLEVERWYQKEVALDDEASIPEDSIIPVFLEWLEARLKTSGNATWNLRPEAENLKYHSLPAGPASLEEQMEGMIAFNPQGDLGAFQEAYFNDITLLNIEDRKVLNNLLFSIWQFGNEQWQKGKTFGQQEFRQFNELYSKAGFFAVNTFPDATPAIHLLKLIQEANEVIQDPKDLKEWADVSIAFIAAIYRSGFSPWQVFEAGLAKIEEVKKLDWLKLEDGTYQSIKPKTLNPAEAVLAFVAWLTVRPEAITMSSAHEVPAALEAALFFNKIQGFEEARNTWPDVAVPMRGHDRALPERTPVLRCPEGLTAVSSECGEMNIHCRIDRIEIGPEGAEAIDRRGNRAKVTVCGVDIGSTPWNPKPSRWQRFKAWLIKALAPLGGWGERMSDQ